MCVLTLATFIKETDACLFDILEQMWIHSRTFALFAVALSILGVVHVVATSFYLYWTYPWLDIPLHALGGAVVSLGFLVLFHAYVHGHFGKGLAVTLGAVLAVGAVWEVFEFVSVIAGSEPGYVQDTILDFVMDLAGGCVGYAAARVEARHGQVAL